MKAPLQANGPLATLSLPAPAAAALAGASETEVLVLREGLLLVAAPGVLEQLAASTLMPSGSRSADSGHALLSAIPASKAGAPPWPANLSSEEAALLRKLSAIKFEERTVPAAEKLLSATEKKILSQLSERKFVTVFRNAKYPKGVYSLSPLAYAAAIEGPDGPSVPHRPNGPMRGAHAQEVKLEQALRAGGPMAALAQAATSKGALAGKPNATPSAPSTPAAASTIPLPSRALSINTVEHLVALGYMVLDNENDAKRVMPEINLRLKNDDVRGVRGFDKRYYVLRRSFLYEYEGPLLAIVDQSPCTAEEVAVKLNLSPEAVRVLLMILGDAGEVIEKRRGHWIRA